MEEAGRLDLAVEVLARNAVLHPGRDACMLMDFPFRQAAQFGVVHLGRAGGSNFPLTNEKPA